ncbi:unnamed protein product [Linum tenue]|uniref:Uncharacterized protein n=1 Tax=Linum tenue TaxID=586396 RepID=A0AAV0NN46_9ROSI|nr:unnamed protein product [Linum tenue]
MTRSNPEDLIPRDDNINHTLRLLARERELREARERLQFRAQPQIEARVVMLWLLFTFVYMVFDLMYY